MTLSKIIAKFVVETNIDKIPLNVQDKAKFSFIDCLGCILAGSKEDNVEKLVEYVKEFGGNSVSTVLGQGFKSSPYNAALINGVAAHVLDYDDVGKNLTGHPSVAILPAVLAVGEQLRISGTEALEAFIIGVEVASAIGRGINPEHYKKGWHATSTLGIFGATAAVGKLLKLDVEKLSNAFGIAVSESSGMQVNFGTMTKSLHAGRAAAKGVMAVNLADKGFTSSETAFEGESGFFTIMANDYDLDKIIDGLGNPFEFEDPGVSIKPYSSCKGTHNGIDAMLHLVDKFDINPEEVKKIDCGVLQIAKDILICPEPKTGLEGKFSMPFCLALAMAERNIRLDHFTDEKVNDPMIKSIISKVDMDIDEEFSKKGYFNGTWDTVVTVKMNNGDEYKKTVIHAKGDPGNPLNEKEIFKKYIECGKMTIDGTSLEKSCMMLYDFNNVSDINDLIDLF
jgi:2-methylcitrate dehydratase PrpD